MTSLTTKKQKAQARQFVDPNPVEAIKNIGSGVGQSIVSDVLKTGANDFWKQVLGADKIEKTKHAMSGDLSEGQDLELAPHLEIEPGIDYRREILHGEKRTSKEHERVLETKIEEILIELRRLVSSSEELAIQYKEIVVEQRIENPGTYHESFFEWILNTIRAARMRIEDSGAWLAAFQSKKNKRQYWQMFKKHGTTFGLSNERVVATQTG